MFAALYPRLYFAAAAICDKDKQASGFFGLPKWYKYLPYDLSDVTHRCEIQVTSIAQYWLIGFALIDILLRVAGLIAIGFVVWGGIQFVTSQGEPDKTAAARSTVINALIGLVIAVAAATIVTFIAGRFVK